MFFKRIILLILFNSFINKKFEKGELRMKKVNQERVNQEVINNDIQAVDLSDFEEMEEVVTPGFFGLFGCCVDATW